MINIDTKAELMYMITNLLNGLLEKLLKNTRGIDTFETIVNRTLIPFIILVTLHKLGVIA